MPKNPRNAGAPKKYKTDVKTKTIHWLIPTEIEKDLREIVDEKSKEYQANS